MFSVSSRLYLIFRLSNTLLCLSAFYHYYKIPETINLKEEKFILSFAFGVFRASSLGSIAFGPVQGPKYIMTGAHGRGSCLPHSQEAKERQELDRSPYPLHDTPSIMTSWRFHHLPIPPWTGS
jgi:hypothetical protein